MDVNQQRQKNNKIILWRSPDHKLCFLKIMIINLGSHKQWQLMDDWTLNTHVDMHISVSLHTNMHIIYNSKVQNNVFNLCQALID